MIYNYTKCESVIAKIMADLDSTEVRQRVTDIREWIFEAVNKIGAPMQYITRESGSDGFPILKIEDYQAPMPQDLVHLDGVAYSTSQNGKWEPMRTKTGIFKEPNRGPAKIEIVHENDHNLADNPDEKEEIIPPMQYKYPTTQEQMVVHTLSKNIPATQMQYEEPEYFIKPGWIVTNKKNGYLKLAYKSIATDDRGYPLIPDLASYQEAIYWYVVMKLSFPKYLKGKLGGKGVNNNYNVYAYLQQQWNFYRGQAYAEAMMPTQDDMRNIKNDWNKLIPDWSSDDTFFKHTGKREITYNDYYYGY